MLIVIFTSPYSFWDPGPLIGTTLRWVLSPQNSLEIPFLWYPEICLLGNVRPCQGDSINWHKLPNRNWGTEDGELSQTWSNGVGEGNTVGRCVLWVTLTLRHWRMRPVLSCKNMKSHTFSVVGYFKLWYSKAKAGRVHTLNSNTKETESGKSLWIWGQPGLHTKIWVCHSHKVRHCLLQKEKRKER